MSANFRKAMEEAGRILKENYVTTPPVEIVEIAKNYGFSILETSLDNGVETDNKVAGFIDAEKKIIYVNINDSQSRKAFTVAHELGHWFLHQQKLKDAPDKYAILYRKPIGGETDDVEKEANCFAAHLLVPGAMLDQYKSENDNTIASIFGVSPELIGYRKEQEYAWRR